MKRLLLILAVVAFFATAVFFYFRNTSQLELQIKQLESQVATQEKKITETRNQNDTRVRERVQEVYQEYEALEDLNEDELNAKWEEFMGEVKKRNYERQNSLDNKE